MKRILTILKNKYLIVGIFFIVWITFFDSNRLIAIYKHKKELREVEKERDYYLENIKKNTELLELYKKDIKALEKLAREKYLMKKDDEDIFLIVYED